MTAKKIFPLFLLVAAGILSLTLTSCNTIEGMGQDMKSAGEAVSGAAKKTGN